MANVREDLKAKLAASPDARRKFMDGMRKLLADQGLPNDDQALKDMGFTELDVNNQKWTEAALSSVVITITA